MMDLPWILGTLGAIAFFAFFEWRAFKFPYKQNTLSRFIYDIGSNWPLSIFLMGMFCGGLAVHFFWHWCPAGSVSTGFLDPSYNEAFIQCLDRVPNDGSTHDCFAMIGQ